MYRRTLLIAAGLGLFAVPVSAQDWREVTSFRQRAAESRLHVHARYGAGTLAIRAGSGAELYRVNLRYDADVFDPVTNYENERLEVGVEGTGRSIQLKDSDSGAMTLWLSPEVPLDLDLQFGAGEARLDLGGLQVSGVAIETGASETELQFATPNPVECRELSLAMGAASFEARGLANANCRVVTVEGGAGDVTLDFSGEWRRDLSADVTVALGSVTIYVPDDVGVRVDQDTFLADFSGSRFERRDGSRFSENWETADRRLMLDMEGAFGSIDVRWLTPATATP